MTNKQLENKLKSIRSELNTIFCDDYLHPNTPLFAYLAVARFAISLSVVHTAEYDGEASQIGEV